MLKPYRCIHYTVTYIREILYKIIIITVKNYYIPNDFYSRRFFFRVQIKYIGDGYLFNAHNDNTI